MPPTDHQYIERARLRCDDDLIVQEPGVGSPAEGGTVEIVDLVEGGAWVMAWIYVSDGEFEE